MRKLLGTFLLLCALCIVPHQAKAQEAADITNQVVFTAASNARHAVRLTDREYQSSWQGARGSSKLELASQLTMHGMYICWTQDPQAFYLQEQIDGVWSTIMTIEASPLRHQYYPLSGQRRLRLMPVSDNGKNFGISEIFILGDGEVPSWVQQWEPSYEDADLMLLFAHPDDEVLFFGGLLPYYGAERGLKVLPVALSAGTPVRVHELLNSLWSLGIRHYPVFGGFDDRYSWKLEEAYRHHGKKKTADFITDLIRRHKPEVIVSHDVDGEYGHGMHRLCADMALKGVQYAADPSRSPASAERYGTFQVSKLYLHLYQEKGHDVELEMNWNMPLNAFGGKTGFEMAQEAYQYHLSQHRYEQYKVEPRDSARSSYRFGLAFTTVGQDILKDDMFENIPTFVVQ